MTYNADILHVYSVTQLETMQAQYRNRIQAYTQLVIHNKRAPAELESLKASLAEIEGELARRLS